MEHFKSLSELHRVAGFPAVENPLFSLVRCDKTFPCSMANAAFTSDFYMIWFKKLKSGVFLYGRTKYDHESGSMLFTKPRQVVELKNLEFEEDGFTLFIHEDFLNGHPLHADIQSYAYFEYETHEALHLSPKEEQIIWELYRSIETEYYNNEDEYSKSIILGHLDSILKYAQRFYKRQFINRTGLSGTTVSKFNDFLSAYVRSGFLQEKGLPTVALAAAELHLSTRYLSDLLKQETGKTAIELIHIFLISEAKNLLLASDNNIAETAYTLGFDNLPYFSRLFKKEVGITPVQFKKQHFN
jgi:AraC family transcriptional activator of pobA